MKPYHDKIAHIFKKIKYCMLPWSLHQYLEFNKKTKMIFLYDLNVQDNQIIIEDKIIIIRRWLVHLTSVVSGKYIHYKRVWEHFKRELPLHFNMTFFFNKIINKISNSIDGTSSYKNSTELIAVRGLKLFSAILTRTLLEAILLTQKLHSYLHAR